MAAQNILTVFVIVIAVGFGFYGYTKFSNKG